MFYPPYEFDIQDVAAHYTSLDYDQSVMPDDAKLDDRGTRPLAGALYDFMHKFDKFMTKPENQDREVTLTAHSAGTLIACEMLARFPTIRYRNIVFMAAACSLNDFQRAVIPYLISKNTGSEGTNKPDSRAQEPFVHFYDLCLHPQHEVDEWRIGDTYPPSDVFIEPLVERGSLLEWIDNFFSTPESFMDRMLGKWPNIVEAAHIVPSSIRPYVTIKGFGYNAEQRIPVSGFVETTYAEWARKGGGPQTHGGFGQWPFWEDWFWKPLKAQTL